jgi:GNAT superfamily N-acetyltransferase
MSHPDVRPLEEASWPEAMRLCGRAFSNYQYVLTLVGEDPVARLAATTAEFASSRWDPSNLGVGAWAGLALVGLAVVSASGDCRLCRADGGGPSPSPAAGPAEPHDVLTEAGARFDRIRREAHAPFPSHALVSHVAVEPLVQGTGVGRAVVEGALDRFRRVGGGLVLLECIRELEPFYARFGFEVVSTFRDPDADDMLVMTAAL